MTDDSPGDSSILSIHQQAVTQPLVCGLDSLNQELAQRDVLSPGDEMLKNTVDDCLTEQLSDLQLNKVCTFVKAINIILFDTVWMTDNGNSFSIHIITISA